MTMLLTPDWTASSTPYWITGLSTSTSISFGCALVAGRNRVPRPAAGKTALRTVPAMALIVSQEPASARRGGTLRRGGLRLGAVFAERFGAAGAVVRCERERARDRSRPSPRQP